MRGLSVTPVRLVAFAVLMIAAAAVRASDPATTVDDAARLDRIDHEGLKGTLVICGGGSLNDDIRAAFLSAVPSSGSIVILAAASEERTTAAQSATEWLAASFDGTISTPDAAEHSDAEAGNPDVARIADVIDATGGVWMCGGQQSRLAECCSGTDVEEALRRLLNRGGVIGGTSAGAAIMSRTMIASGREEPRMGNGFDLLPDAIVDQHFTQRNRQPRSRVAVATHPNRFGLGIDEGTAVVVRGRNMQVLGSGTATVLLPECSYREATETVLRAGDLADLTRIRRAAAQRATNVNPGIPQQPGRGVEHGALVIVGGGGMPQDIVDRFVELAGGPDARIVCLPTAVPRREAFRQSVPGFLADAGVASVTMLPQSRLEEVESAEFRAALESATGIWFGGGRQWNFVDAYEGTSAVELFRDVLKRGGAIGGSSAGATIQGEFLVRGHPLGNTVMMAEGYERGFGFLPGTAIDQHFSQRQRRADLPPVISRHPQMLGIGIDEGTALVVREQTAEVIGTHAAHFLTAERLQRADIDSQDAHSGRFEELYISVPTGSRIDLVTLAVTALIAESQ